MFDPRDYDRDDARPDHDLDTFDRQGEMIAAPISGIGSPASVRLP